MDSIIPQTALITCEGEPRILDTDLARALDLHQPLNFRAVIAANREELEAFGGVLTRHVKTTHKGGRPGRAYLLNEGQALVMCALSRTSKAAAVRHALITVFLAWRRGELESKPVTVKAHRRALPSRWTPPPESRADLERRLTQFFRAFRDRPEALASWAAENIMTLRHTADGMAGDLRRL